MSNLSLAAKIKTNGYTPFVIKKEEPNFYKLEDGSILRIYPILNGIMMDKKIPNSAAANIQNVVVAYVPTKLRGPKTAGVVALDQAIANPDKTDLGFEIINEHFNEYVLDNKWLLNVKTTLAQVNRSKLRNNLGEPIYSVNTALVTKFKMKGSKK